MACASPVPGVPASGSSGGRVRSLVLVLLSHVDAGGEQVTAPARGPLQPAATLVTHAAWVL